MSIWRKRAPNINIVVPDWTDPCRDVLQLPSMLVENGNEGYFRIAADGPLGKAAQELTNLYKRYCQRKPAVIQRVDGTSVDSECWQPDEDLLVAKLFGQAFDPDMRIAFGRCLLEIGQNPTEIITIGEKAFAQYVQEEADRMTAHAVAREQVDRQYGELLPKYIDGEVLKAFRELLVTMTVTLGYTPLVEGVIGVRRDLVIAVIDVEAMVKRKLPRGARLPKYVSKIGSGYFLTLNALALFGLQELRDWYFENEENERVSDLYYGLNSLQYHLMNGSPEGRRALDSMFDSLFGTKLTGDSP